ncbi:MAG: ABC transporter ATP-binding protein [Candidatus Pacebacteria bacterium]|nr:ABC transporter ATP-binding protein [Candidatus Paceibacterota bacterium]
MEPIIILKEINKKFDTESVALSKTNLEIKKGEFVCIIGASGSGKSTILNLIAGIETPTSGTLIKPQDIAMVFQNGALLPWMTVLENVAIAIEAKLKNESGKSGLRKTKFAIQTEAINHIKLMGLGDFVYKYPHELSGGQRQRVGIARALAVNTQVLLLDEPFSALDTETTIELHKDLLKIWQDTGKTIVMVSHSIEEAITLANRIIMVQDHTIKHIFPISISRPRHEQTTEFMTEFNKIRSAFLKK